jgi:hypothetical protein
MSFQFRVHYTAASLWQRIVNEMEPRLGGSILDSWVSATLPAGGAGMALL